MTDLKREIFRLEPVLVAKPWGAPPDLWRAETGVEFPADAGDRYGEAWTASAYEAKEGFTNRATPAAGGDPRTVAGLAREFGAALTGPRGARGPDEARGKTEAWYVRAVGGPVKFVTGLRPEVTPADFREAIASGLLENPPGLEALEERLVTTLAPEPGTALVLKPGALHTIWPMEPEAWVVFDEVQQAYGDSRLATLSKILFVQGEPLSLQIHPSDKLVAEETRPEVAERYRTEPTIRASDLGRGRPTQPDLAAEIAAYGLVASSATEPIGFEVAPGARRTIEVANSMFAAERYDLEAGAEVRLGPEPGSYRVLVVARGSGRFETRGGGPVACGRGEAYLLPAAGGEWRIGADEPMRVMVNYVPDVAALAADLRKLGYADDRIAGLDGRCYTNDFEGLCDSAV